MTASISTRLAAQASVFKVCAGNAAQHCKGVKGEVHIAQCLVKTERIDSAKCNQAITDDRMALRPRRHQEEEQCHYVHSISASASHSWSASRLPEPGG